MHDNVKMDFCWPRGISRCLSGGCFEVQVHIIVRRQTCLISVAAGLCADNPCINGGTCTELDGNLVCTCPTNYEGTYCHGKVQWSCFWNKGNFLLVARYGFSSYFRTAQMCKDLCLGASYTGLFLVRRVHGNPEQVRRDLLSARGRLLRGCGAKNLQMHLSGWVRRRRLWSQWVSNISGCLGGTP